MRRPVETSTHNAGFSLIELMVALGLMGILAAIFSLNFDTIYQNSTQSRVEDVLKADIRRAQAEAQSQGGRVIVATTDSSHYTIGVDLFPYSNAGVADTILKTRSLSNGITVNVGGSIIFDPRGFVIDTAGTLTTASVTLQHSGATYFSKTLNQAGVM